MNLYTIKFKGELDIVAKDETEANEKAAEYLPTEAEITETNFDGPLKPNC